MDAYFIHAVPKINNLVQFLETELKAEEERGNLEIDQNIITSVRNKYAMLMRDPITLVMVVKEIIPYFDTEAHVIKRTDFEKFVDEQKKEAFRSMSEQPEFDPEAFKKSIEYKLPEHVNERIYRYLAFLCDLGLSFKIDSL